MARAMIVFESDHLDAEALRDLAEEVLIKANIYSDERFDLVDTEVDYSEG